MDKSRFRVIENTEFEGNQAKIRLGASALIVLGAAAALYGVYRLVRSHRRKSAAKLKIAR